MPPGVPGAAVGVVKPKLLGVSLLGVMLGMSDDGAIIGASSLAAGEGEGSGVGEGAGAGEGVSEGGEGGGGDPVVLAAASWSAGVSPLAATQGLTEHTGRISIRRRTHTHSTAKSLRSLHVQCAISACFMKRQRQVRTANTNAGDLALAVEGVLLTCRAIQTLALRA